VRAGPPVHATGQSSAAVHALFGAAVHALFGEARHGGATPRVFWRACA